MKGSESLWNEEELLAEMEQMQDQIEQLQQKNAVLSQTAAEIEGRLQNQEQTSSSEILRLRSALQQSQKKLQEQSERIVRLSEADLILQENEKLKEVNERLRSEKEETKRKAALEAEAAEEKIKRRGNDILRRQETLRKKEEALKTREQEISDTISQQNEIIQRKVEGKTSVIRWGYETEYRKKRQEISREYERKKRRFKLELMAVVLYGVIITVHNVVCLSGFDRLKGLGGLLWGGVTAVWNMLRTIADRIALNSLRLPGDVPHQLLYYVVYWGIIGVIGAAVAVAIFKAVRWIVRRSGASGNTDRIESGSLQL